MSAFQDMGSLLLVRGADELEHAGGSLYVHLHRVAKRLTTLGYAVTLEPQAAVKITLQGDTRAQHEMTVDSHAWIVLSLGQEKDFAPDLCSLLKLGPIVVEAG